MEALRDPAQRNAKADLPLRMGVLGCSRHYALRVATPLKSSFLVEPYGIASRDIKKASEFAKIWNFPAFYGNYEELLADPNVDFIYIPLPNHLHFEYIKKCADAGKPVLCEKPLCLNAKEATLASEYCEKKKVPLMEAFMYRFHPQWVRAAEIVKSGEIGKALFIQTIFGYNNTDAANIRNKLEYGGGALLDIGCYAVSVARLLMGGRPEKVAVSMKRDPVFGTDILTSAILDYGDGRVSTFSVSTQMFPCQHIIVTGTSGSLSMEIPFNMPADIPGKLTVTTGISKRVVETEIADQYLLLFEAFAQALIDGTANSEFPVPISDTLANMTVLNALFAAGSSGNWESV